MKDKFINVILKNKNQKLYWLRTMFNSSTTLDKVVESLERIIKSKNITEWEFYKWVYIDVSDSRIGYNAKELKLIHKYFE